MRQHPVKRRWGISLLMITGTLASIEGKLIYSLRAPGRHGEIKPFAKPWFCAMLMFVGMSICLPCSLLWRKVLKSGKREEDNGTNASVVTGPSVHGTSDAEEPLLSDRESVVSVDTVESAAAAWWSRYSAVLFPTVFDLIASALLSVGLLFVTTSLYQMMRGTEVIFAAMLSVVILRRRLNSPNIWGLFLCSVGLALVGYSGYLSASGPDTNSNFFALIKDAALGTTARQTLLGMTLIIIAEAVQSSQIVAEDWLMTISETKLPPVEVVGYEGVFGMLLMGFIVLPLLQFSRFGVEGSGLQEDTLESLIMLKNSPRLAAWAGTYVALMAGYNMGGMLVTDSMGALSRTVAETARTILVWGVNLSLYYYVHIPGTKKGSIGEPWTSYSWMQAVGFAILVVGTGIYAQGEERHAKEMKEKLERRAREGWAILRASVPRLLGLGRMEEAGNRLSIEERRTPARPPRIAGPARIRVALGLLKIKQRLRRRTEHGAGVDVEGHTEIFS